MFLNLLLPISLLGKERGGWEVWAKRRDSVKIDSWARGERGDGYRREQGDVSRTEGKLFLEV